MSEQFRLTGGSSTVLDLIRGISAQLVVVGHGISFFGVLNCLRPPHFPWIQNIAVLVFFILSGFLITYSTVRKLRSDETYSFKQYFIDRFARIYSAFIPALVFILLLDFISIRLAPENYAHWKAFDLRTFFGNVLMLQDFPFLKHTPVDAITSFGSARPFWTLAIEWWIYLFFGYLVLVILRKKLKLHHLAVIAVFAIVPVVNLVGGRGNGLFVYWLFGSAIYLLMVTNTFSRISNGIKWTMLVVLLLLAALRMKITMVEYEAVFAFILMLCIALLTDLFSQVKFSAPLEKLIRWNAGFSYTLYLVHYSVLDFIFTHFSDDASPVLLFLAGFFASNIISFVIARYSEDILTLKVKSWLYGRIAKD